MRKDDCVLAVNPMNAVERGKIPMCTLDCNRSFQLVVELMEEPPMNTDRTLSAGPPYVIRTAWSREKSKAL
jgi:hypothetical protein